MQATPKAKQLRNMWKIFPRRATRSVVLSRGQLWIIYALNSQDHLKNNARSDCSEHFMQRQNHQISIHSLSLSLSNLHVRLSRIRQIIKA